MVQQPEDFPIAPTHIQMRPGYSEVLLLDEKEKIAADTQEKTLAAESRSAGQSELGDAVGVGSTGFAYPNVQVKNTFIQVEDSGESEAPAHRVRRRPQHHRCVSEPLWIVRPFSEPSDPCEPLSLSLMMSQSEDVDDFGRSRQAVFNSYEEVDPASQHKVLPSLDSPAERSAGVANAETIGFKHVGRHLRQLSGGSSASNAMPGCAPGSEGSMPMFPPDPRLSDPWAMSRIVGMSSSFPSKPHNIGAVSVDSTSAGGKDSMLASSLPASRDDDHTPEEVTATGSHEEAHRIHRNHLRQCSTLTHDSFDMVVGSQTELEQEAHRIHRNHLRQCSTLTHDSFDMAVGSQIELEQEPADRSAELVFDTLRMAPDPRLSDPWSLAAIAKKASMAPTLESIGGSALSNSPLPAVPREPNQSTWPQHGADIDGGFPRQATAADATGKHLQQEKQMLPIPVPPFGGARNGTADSYTPSPMQTSPAPMQPPAVMDHANLFSSLPLWSQQAANNLTDVDAMTAYARGVAAGVEFAKGFALGAASVVAKAPVPPGRIDRHGENENAKAPRTGDQPMKCKWYQRGTCKFGAECRYLHDGHIEQTVPEIAIECQDGGRDAVDAPQVEAVSSRRISLEGALCQKIETDEHLLAERQIFWCDQRAFKDAAADLKEQLETETGLPVKTYRTAEMCIRLLRKKRHWQTKSVSRYFLVSWANAQSLVPFLSQQPSLSPRVVVLCDTCGSRGCGKAEAWRRDHPIVEAVATSWPHALSAIKSAVEAS